jgi:RNA-directed DNA polymerase
MTHGRGESDSAIVAGKPTNKAERSAAELVEPRAEAEGNANQQSTGRAQSRGTVSQALVRIRQAARQRKKEKFTALLHHISIEALGMAFFALKRDAAPGVDGLTWRTYEADLDRNLTDLHERVHRGAYRALPSRRTYIPKADGKQRPLAIAALEDKIVQRATVAVLNAIYEEDFLGFSYGFRPGRGTHDALDALVVGIESTKVNWILDADIRSFFDEISQQWLIRFLEHRIGDRRIIRLIQKWLKAGILEDGVATVSERGTGQGAVISPLLANVYLHYVLDLWAERWRRREATGDMIIVRYADDFIVGFQHEGDARHFLDAMRERLQEFALSLHPEKTRLIEFGRLAVENRKRRGLGKPETFTFLGFIFICNKTRRGRFQIKRKSRRDRMRVKLRAIKQELRRRMHQQIPEQGKWLRQIVTGYFNYHAVPTNGQTLAAFRSHVTNLWQRTLRQRSQKDWTTKERIVRLADDWLPRPQILHPWPDARFAVRYPRWEPYARIGLVRICAGGAR